MTAKEIIKGLNGLPTEELARIQAAIQERTDERQAAILVEKRISQLETGAEKGMTREEVFREARQKIEAMKEMEAGEQS